MFELLTDRCASHVLESVLVRAPALLQAEHARGVTVRAEDLLVSASASAKSSSAKVKTEPSSDDDGDAEMSGDDSGGADGKDSSAASSAAADAAKTPIYGYESVEPPSLYALLLRMAKAVNNDWLELMHVRCKSGASDEFSGCLLLLCDRIPLHRSSCGSC